MARTSAPILVAAMVEIEAEQRDVSAETSAGPDPDKPMPCPIEQKRADAVERLADSFVSSVGRGHVHDVLSH